MDIRFSSRRAGQSGLGGTSRYNGGGETSPRLRQSTVPTTTLTGYVDTSMVWNLGTHNANDPAPGFAGGANSG